MLPTQPSHTCYSEKLSIFTHVLSRVIVHSSRYRSLYMYRSTRAAGFSAQKAAVAFTGFVAAGGAAAYYNMYAAQVRFVIFKIKNFIKVLGLAREELVSVTYMD